MTAGPLRPPRVEAFADTQLLRFESLADCPGLVHAVTTRPWNMAPHRGPQAELAVERRRRICEHLGLDFERLTAVDQIHSHHVLRVGPGDVGAGRFGRETALRFADGLVCDLPGVPLLQLSADCPLVLVFDPVRRALGTAHASWRGTVARIAEQLVAVMVRANGCRPADLRAGIAACAGPERYEIGDDVRRVALELLPDAERYFPRVGERRCFDLRAANRDQLLRAGVPVAAIEIMDACTISHPRFYSHRRDGKDTGRFALIAAVV